MPVVEFIPNDASTTVAASHGTVAAGTTESWTVASSALFVDSFGNGASTGIRQFRVIDAADVQQPPEIILVTNVSGTTWSVTRGAEGTAPTSHSAGFTVWGSATAANLANNLALPSYGIGSGSYLPDLGVYIPPGVGFMRELRNAVAAAKGGAAGVKVGYVGASNVAGYDGTVNQRGLGFSYPERIRDGLEAMGYPMADGSARMTDSSTPDVRWSRTGTWTANGSGTSSPTWSTATVGATTTFQAVKRGTVLEIDMSAGGGSGATAFSITLDGSLLTATNFPGATVTVTHGSYVSTTGVVTGDNTNNTLHIVITGLVDIPHVALLTITAVGAIPFGADCYHTNDIRLANFGVSGSRSSQWQDVATNWYTMQNQVLMWAPAIVVVDMGIMFNDFQQSVAQATSITQVESFINALKTAGITVILFGVTPAISGTTGTPASTWYGAALTIADATSCLLIENYDRWYQSESSAQSAGLVNSTDTVHPTIAGYVALAIAFLNALGVKPVSRPAKPAPLIVSTGSTYTIPDSVTDGTEVVLNLTANLTLTAPTIKGGGSFVLTIKSNSHTITWGTPFDWGTAGAPTLSTSTKDKVVCDCSDGASWTTMLAGTGF